MSETLFSATRAIAKFIPGNVVVDGAATSDGAAGKTTLVDNAAWFVSPTTLPADDYFNGGTIWFIDQVTGSANDGYTAIITDYSSSTGTYTFAAINAQTKTGDTYSASNRMYPRFILRQAVNYALADIGGEDLYNTATTTVADQMNYDLPSGVYNILRVEQATSTSSPYGYVPLNHWREINDDIFFEDGYQPSSTGYILRLTYRIPFAELTADTSALPDLADMNWVKWCGVAYCLRWKLGLTDGDERVQSFLEEALLNAEKMARQHRPKMRQIPRGHEHAKWGGGVISTDSDVDSVRI